MQLENSTLWKEKNITTSFVKLIRLKQDCLDLRITCCTTFEGLKQVAYMHKEELSLVLEEFEAWFQQASRGLDAT